MQREETNKTFKCHFPELGITKTLSLPVSSPILDVISSLLTAFLKQTVVFPKTYLLFHSSTLPIDNSLSVHQKNSQLLTLPLSSYPEIASLNLPNLVLMKKATQSCYSPSSPVIQTNSPKLSPQEKGLKSHYSNESSKVQYLLSGRLNRQEALSEILTTEMTFVTSLKIFIDYFLTPLQNNTELWNLVQEQGGVPVQMCKEVKNIYTLHSKFADILQERYKTFDASSNLGDIFIDFIPYLKLYSFYTLNYDLLHEAFRKLITEREDFKKFVVACEENEKFKGFKINDILIMPIQRLTRYRLLIGQLLSLTQENHADWPKLKQSISQVEAVVAGINNVNSSGKMNEVFGQLDNIPSGFTFYLPGRYFVKQGPVKKGPRGKRGGLIGMGATVRGMKERELFVFNDLVIYTKPLDANTKKYGVMGFVNLYPGKWEVLKEENEGVGNLSIVIVSKTIDESVEEEKSGDDEKLTLWLKNQDEKNEWVVCLEKLKNPELRKGTILPTKQNLI